MNLTDGQWHRLHPASPLLKGGLALIAILGVLLANFRERLVDSFVPGMPGQRDPIDYIIDRGFLGYALAAVAVVLLVLIAGFYASWRMHTFRITEEVVEVRSGILFRTNRKARLDRIQGINIVRPFFARLFGAAKLEISQAGQDANVQLSYLASGSADGLRREILRLASGARAPTVGLPVGGSPLAGPALPGLVEQSVLDRRAQEFFGPDPDLAATPADSIVTIHLGRLFGSLVLHGSTVFLVLVGTGITAWVVTSGELFGLFLVLPGVIGFGSFYVRRFAKTLRYTIAATPDGVRVGFGLLSTTSETVPPGRIHSVRVSQPLLWRPVGWWEVSVNRASHSSTKGAAGQSSATILPVGNLDEVQRVLELLLPEFGITAPFARHSGEDAVATSGARLIGAGMTAAQPHDGFVTSPPRAVWLRPFAWRRNGFAVAYGSLLLRRGGIWRQLIIVPQARVQSVSLRQGPLLRMLRLASVHLHTVSGPILATLGALDRQVALDFFQDAARTAIVSAARDTSHRWRAGEAPA